MAEHGVAEYRRQVSQDACWYMDHPQFPMPQALRDYQYRAHERMAQGKPLDEALEPRLGTSRKKRIVIAQEVRVLVAPCMKPEQAFRDVAVKPSGGPNGDREAYLKEYEWVKNAFAREQTLLNKSYKHG